MRNKIKINSNFNTSKIIREIILEQSNIVGIKIATERANSTKVINFKNNEVFITGSDKLALEKLIDSYEEIFGKASVDVCLDVIKKFNTIQK
jgi:hypothetical protein